jgi:hypothetical protein
MRSERMNFILISLVMRIDPSRSDLDLTSGYIFTVSRNQKQLNSTMDLPVELVGLLKHAGIDGKILTWDLQVNSSAASRCWLHTSICASCLCRSLPFFVCQYCWNVDGLAVAVEVIFDVSI